MGGFDETYRGKRILITGHTGFKGSWLTLWLHELGAHITGIALPSDSQLNHFDLLKLPIDDRRCDIRNVEGIKQIFKEKSPEVVFHLAAQPLVRRSYKDPLETWSTNVMGTVNILEACRQNESVNAIVVVTTDKCYLNQEKTQGYHELDSLGGHDPYSASKAGSELVAASYRDAFYNIKSKPLLATARAGNVIGGGDWSEDRLIPDIIRAIELNHSLEIRSPSSTRPWQHVLESLNGYLLLGQKLLSGDKAFAEAWNFGPNLDGNRSVAEVLSKLQSTWKELQWRITDQPQPHETKLLYLDNTKAKSKLDWNPVWGIDEALLHTASWYQAWMEAKKVISRQQLADFIAKSS
jgi:CDP-glucose 4,6-dehydratase